MTFQQLLYVVEIANCGSINRAASKLFISQSAVSSAVKQLENELQTELFVRTNSGITTTETGRRFVTYAISMLARKKEMENIFSSKNNTYKEFSIISQHYQFCASAFSILFKEEASHKCIFTYKESFMDEVINHVSDGRANIGIIMVSNINRDLVDYYLTKKNLIFTSIREIQPCAFLSKNHPLAQKKSLTVNDVIDYPYITFSHNSEMPVDFSEGVNILSLHSYNKQLVTNDRSVMISLLCSTDAISTGSGLIVKEFHSPDLISIPITDTGETMYLGWVYKKGQELGKYEKKYLEILEDELEKAYQYTLKIWNKAW